MGFEASPNGTYGARQPGNTGIEGRVGRWLVRRARRSRRSAARRGILALTTVGARTGLERTSPVGYVVEGDTWVIWATAGGGRTNPAWYLNIAAHPDRVVIEVAGQRIPVTATQLDPADADAKITEIAANGDPITRRRLTGYRAATDRAIPVIRLSRRLPG